MQELPRIFRGLKQARDHAGLEFRDPRRLRFQFQDAGLDAVGPGLAVSVLTCRVLHPRAPENREQIARRLGRGAEARTDPERLQGLSEPPALALVSRCRHFASVWP